MAEDKKYDFSDFDDNNSGLDFSDFDEPKAPEVKKPISKAQSLLKGAEQGVTFGQADKLAGGVQGGLDLLAQLFPSMLPENVSKTPNQMNEDLKWSGATAAGKEFDSSYQAGRDDEAAQQAEAANANPLTYGAGAIGGGILTGAGLANAARGTGAVAQAASKVLSPFGELPANASVLAQAARANTNALPLSVGLGLASNSADYTKGEMPKVEELGENILLGQGAAAALPGVAKGVKAAADTKVGQAIVSPVKSTIDKVAKAVAPEYYELGKKGVDTSSPELLPQVQSEADSIINKLNDTILQYKALLTQKEEQLAALTQRAKATKVDTEKAALDIEIKKLTDQKKQVTENIKKAQTLKRQAEANARTEAIELERQNAAALKQQLQQQEAELHDALTARKNENALQHKERLDAQNAKLDEQLAAKQIEAKEYKAQKELLQKKTGEIVKRQNDDDIRALDKQMTEIKNKQAMETAQAQAQFEQGLQVDQKTLNAKQAAAAEQVEQAVETKFNDIGSQYDALDLELDQAGVKYNLNKDIESFVSRLPETDQDAWARLLSKGATEDLDRAGFVRIRDLVGGKLKDPNVPYEVKSELRQLMSDIRANQANTIKGKVGEEAYQQFLNLNNQFSKLTGLQKRFFARSTDLGSTKTLGLFKDAQSISPEAQMRAKDLATQLGAVGDETLSKNIMSPIDEMASEQAAFQQQKFVEQQNPDLAAKLNELTGQKTEKQYANKGTQLDEQVQGVLKEDPEYQAIVNKEKYLQEAMQTIEDAKAQGIPLDEANNDAVKNAQKQLEIFKLQKAEKLREAYTKIDTLKKQNREVTPSSILNKEALQNNKGLKNLDEKITGLKEQKQGLAMKNPADIEVSNPELESLRKEVVDSRDPKTYTQALTNKNTNAIGEEIKSLVTNPRLDRTQRNSQLTKLIERHKAATGEDLTEQIKLLNEKLDVLSPEQLQGLSGEQLVGAVRDPQGALSKLVASKITKPLQQAANKLGLTEIQNMSGQAKKAGLTGLAAKIEEMATLPEQQRNARLFILSQNPSFRKLMNKDENK